MSQQLDRRAWLIISRREADALLNASRGDPYSEADYQRAVQTIANQYAYIDGVLATVDNGDDLRELFIARALAHDN